MADNYERIIFAAMSIVYIILLAFSMHKTSHIMWNDCIAPSRIAIYRHPPNKRLHNTEIHSHTHQSSLSLSELYASIHIANIPKLFFAEHTHMKQTEQYFFQTNEKHREQRPNIHSSAVSIHINCFHSIICRQRILTFMLLFLCCHPHGDNLRKCVC